MRMKVDLDDLRGFVAVTELGSFHAAADTLHLSQPALTRRVQKLEAALGVQLIDRETRQLRLSAVGREFFFKARRVLDELDAAVLGIRELGDRATGEITIGAVPTATYYFLPKVIEAFGAQYPRIRVRVLDLSANDVLEAVKRGQAEFGLNLLGVQEADLEFEPLLRDPFRLVCRKDHPLAEQAEVRWAEVAPYRFITVGRLSGNRLILDAALADLKVRPRWFYEVQHLITSLGLVEAGLGVAAVPQMAVPTGQHPVLAVRPLIEPTVTRMMGIIRRRGATLSPAAQQFHQLLKERWGTE
ncbi:MAG: LysR family transcriptional regulator [Geminicoccaceae bacterium]